MEQLVQQLRLSARSLARARGFFVSAVLVLAIAIGATAAVFGLVDAVLLRPLPFRDADRLLVVWEKNAARHRMRNPAGPSNLLAWRERSLSFASLEALYIGIMPTLGGGEPERVRATRVTPGLLPSLGVAPVLGRQLRPEEGLPGRGRVAVLSHELFVRRFGGDPAAVGGSIELDGVKHEIAGVLPAGFRLFAPADVLVPLTLDPADRTWQGRSIVVIGRLAPGATQERAQGEMTAIAARLATEYPEGDTGWTVNLVSLKEQLTGELRPALLVLFGAVGLVLLIACTNVANLVLARTAARRHELGVRLALGASGGRLFTQLAAESVLVALAGGAAGLFLARLALDVASAAAPRVAPSFALSARLSPRVVLVALASALAAALVTSLAAVLAAREKDVVRLLKRGTASPAHARTRSALVVGEMALSVVLLVGAGLLTRSVLHLLAVDPGFEPERAVTLTLTLPRVRYDNDEKRAAFLNAALERAAALPGVVAAGTVSTLPLDGLGSATTFTVRGAPPPAPGQKPVADVRAASGAYFAAMGIPLVAGRALPAARVPKGAPVPLVVNRTLARQLFPAGNALGAFLTVEMDDDIAGEVVGVVGDVRQMGLDTEPRATIYWDARSFPTSAFSLVARASGDPSALAPRLLASVRTLDPDVAVSARRMSELVGDSVAAHRSLALLVGGFAAAALLLTAVGLFGVVSYLVTQRTPEVGVRLALGASPGNVAAFVLRGGLSLVGAGAGTGLAAALAAAPLVSGLLHGVSPRDTLTFTSVPVLLAVVAVLACALPALRAARVDPVVALRAE